MSSNIITLGLGAAFLVTLGFLSTESDLWIDPKYHDASDGRAFTNTGTARGFRNDR